MEGPTGTSRKVMVVADPGRESAGALEWALSHAVVEHDELILLHIENLSSRRNTFSTFLKKPVSPALATTAASSTEGGGDIEFLEEMKNACEAAQPKVRVQIERVEMGCKDKASAILILSKMLSIDILVVGQRRNPTILGRLSGGISAKGTDTAEYLIENSKCTCVGVQKKGLNGGYLLNSKTLRNFWLLA